MIRNRDFGPVNDSDPRLDNQWTYDPTNGVTPGLTMGTDPVATNPLVTDPGAGSPTPPSDASGSPVTGAATPGGDVTSTGGLPSNPLIPAGPTAPAAGPTSSGGSNTSTTADSTRIVNPPAASPAGATGSGQINPWQDNNAPYGTTFAGFSPQLHQNDWQTDPRYIAFNYMVNNQTAPTSGWAQNVADALNKQYPGMYSVDNQGQLTWNGGQEYLGLRPNGYGMHAGEFNPNATANEFFWGDQNYGNDQTTSGGTGGGTTTLAPGTSGRQNAGASGNVNLDALLTQLGGLFGPPSQATVQPLTQVGQDPFSQLLTGGWAQLLGQGGGPLTKFGQGVENNIQNILNGNFNSVPAFEKARGDFQSAQNTMMDQVLADLANRGLIGMPGSPEGPQVSAEDYIMRSLAPVFESTIGNFESGLVGNAMQQGSTMAEQDNSNFLNALQTGGNYQSQVANIALQTLAQNNAFNEFVAQFGLNKAQVLNEIINGSNTQLLNALAQFLASVNTSAGGFV